MTGQRAAALALLASGASIEIVAAKLGHSVRTVRRWRAEPAFAAALAEAHVEAVARCGAMLAAVAPAMLATVVQIAQDATATAGARLAAARDVLDRLGVGVRRNGAGDEVDDRLVPLFLGLNEAQKAWIPDEGSGESDPTMN